MLHTTTPKRHYISNWIFKANASTPIVSESRRVESVDKQIETEVVFELAMVP